MINDSGNDSKIEQDSIHLPEIKNKLLSPPASICSLHHSAYGKKVHWLVLNYITICLLLVLSIIICSLEPPK